jgi:hypothetical protein
MGKPLAESRKFFYALRRMSRIDERPVGDQDWRINKPRGSRLDGLVRDRSQPAVAGATILAPDVSPGTVSFPFAPAPAGATQGPVALAGCGAPTGLVIWGQGLPGLTSGAMIMSSLTGLCRALFRQI